MGLAAQGDNRERSLPEDVIQPFETGPEASSLEVKCWGVRTFGSPALPVFRHCLFWICGCEFVPERFVGSPSRTLHAASPLRSSRSHPAGEGAHLPGPGVCLGSPGWWVEGFERGARVPGVATRCLVSIAVLELQAHGPRQCGSSPPARAGTALGRCCNACDAGCGKRRLAVSGLRGTQGPGSSPARHFRSSTREIAGGLIPPDRMVP